MIFLALWVEIPILGYGTTWMKIDGYVIQSVNCHHVPGLDCGARAMEKIVRAIHLNFPKFSITTDIPEDGDLRLPLELPTDANFGIPNFVCDGIKDENQHLYNFKTQMYFLNQVFKDYWILFPFGSVGAFCHVQDGNHHTTNSEPQCLLGITLGWNKFTNRIVLDILGLDNYLYKGLP